MADEKLLGSGLIVISVIVVIIYGWLVFFSRYSLTILKVTAFLAILVLFSLIAWVGYTIATTPVREQ